MGSLSQEIGNLIALFKLYERPTNQEIARKYVPSDDLFAIAQAKYESCPKIENEEVDENGVVRDLFLLEIMNWFKTEFFKWIDSPNCPYCNNSCHLIGSGVPTVQESLKGGNRVELFTCKKCFQDNREVARFPRYNDPVVLLETRKGRCGEWANCFALITRAMGFEVRYVRDWTDHVWVEIYSCGMKPNRWVHVDPCENSYDNPFLYEVGWGKKLSYIIAVSQDDIQDVTWRYIQDKSLSDVLSRRKLCSEFNLVQELLQARQKLQASLPKERQAVLQQRLCYELAEFCFPRVNKEAKDSETVGRQSGSLAWRLARQELGDCSEGDVVAQVGFQWNITENNIRDSQFCLTYDSVKDKYSCNSTNGNSTEFLDGWDKGTYENQNIFRKQEHDWKMVYLARKGISKRLDLFLRGVYSDAVFFTFHRKFEVF